MKDEELHGTNFIFLIPQSTQNKTRNKLIEEYKSKKFFDGVDITRWIECDPATICWFNIQIGAENKGIETLDMYYEKWLNSTKIPLDENLILAREDLDEKDLMRKSIIIIH